MQKAEHKQLRIAWLLLLVYLPMLLAVTFHHHSEAEGNNAVTYCYDCAHHIHHDGHLTNVHDAHFCALCALQSLVYVAPSFVHVAAFVAILNIAYRAICILIKRRECDVKSTRAPPVFA